MSTYTLLLANPVVSKKKYERPCPELNSLVLVVHQHRPEELSLWLLFTSSRRASEGERLTSGAPNYTVGATQEEAAATSYVETSAANDAPLAYSGEYMKQIRLLLLLALVATVLGAAQDQPPQPLNTDPVANAQSASAVVNPEAQSASIRILTPVSGQTVTASFVDLHFELVRPALSGEPNFLVQLDAADPINTSSTDYTFSGLQPGIHTVRVTLVDANKSPVQGGSATVQFKVTAVTTPAHTDGPRGARRYSTRTIAGEPPTAPIPPELRKDGDVNLPLAGSPLPLISLIGFGLLIGGAAQTMRAR